MAIRKPRAKKQIEYKKLCITCPNNYNLDSTWYKSRAEKYLEEIFGKEESANMNWMCYALETTFKDNKDFTEELLSMVIDPAVEQVMLHVGKVKYIFRKHDYE